jgi:hypothetical protein
MVEYKREKFSFAYEKKDGVLTENIAHEERFHLMSAERGILSDFSPETVTHGVAQTKRSSFRFN